jgi:hypothetical protein
LDPSARADKQEYIANLFPWPNKVHILFFVDPARPSPPIKPAPIYQLRYQFEQYSFEQVIFQTTPPACSTPPSDPTEKSNLQIFQKYIIKGIATRRSDAYHRSPRGGNRETGRTEQTIGKEMTPAQKSLFDRATQNEGWLLLRGSAEFRTARNLVALGLGKESSAFTDRYGVRRVAPGANGAFFVITTTTGA